MREREREWEPQAKWNTNSNGNGKSNSNINVLNIWKLNCVICCVLLPFPRVIFQYPMHVNGFEWCYCRRGTIWWKPHRSSHIHIVHIVLVYHHIYITRISTSTSTYFEREWISCVWHGMYIIFELPT